MITIEEMMKNEYVEEALKFLETKKDGAGLDGIKLSELRNYWKINGDDICKNLIDGTYEPGLIRSIEITKTNGKRRTINMLNSVDRLLTSLLCKQLKLQFEENFSKNSYAYQKGKGVAEAVRQAKNHIDSGDNIVVKIDIKEFFDSVNLEELMSIISKELDESIEKLIQKYLYCYCSIDGKIVQKRKGLVQGNPISTVLSNVYLNKLDKYLETKKYHWIRFGDDLSMYFNDKQHAYDAYEEIRNFITIELKLEINGIKSNVILDCNFRLLGYDFYKKNGRIKVEKHKYQKQMRYTQWSESAIEKVNNEYHIIQNGILNKKDFSLLFENAEEKHYIPVEVTNQINLYSNIVLTSGIINTLNKYKIRLAFFDVYGEHIGDFLPESHYKSSTAILKQSAIYNDQKERSNLAKKMEMASIHNMRANLRYYNKNGHHLEEEITTLSQIISKINEQNEINEMMLSEARARSIYYNSFNKILNNKEFRFERRTRRPPKDELNAMISFGNTMLYNKFSQFISKTSLDDRIGIVHSTNKRSHSLNLDFADVFKPIIVDRLIFALINCHQLKGDLHFKKIENGGVYMNRDGKNIFISGFLKKLDSHIIIKGKNYTYRQLMEKEVRDFEKYVLNQSEYKVYKYY